MAQGCEPTPEWQSCYFHDDLQLCLAFYVDDFKMSGPSDKLIVGWDKLRQDTEHTTGISMDSPTPIGRYLGCEHVVGKRKSPITGKIVNSIVYDMSDFFKQAVTDYKALAKLEHVRYVSTPFVPGNADDPKHAQAMSASVV